MMSSVLFYAAHDAMAVGATPVALRSTQARPGWHLLGLEASP